MISLATLCRETGGTFVTTYNVPADTIRRLSDDSDDVDRFFRQMVFNAAIGNTDDHLRNFIMLRSTRGYHLSPAFDLVPDISGDRDHQMAIGYSHSTPTGTDLMSVGKQWIANLTRVRSIVDDVIGAVHQFRATAEALEVDDATIQKFDQDIRWRLQILAKGL